MTDEKESGPPEGPLFKKSQYIIQLLVGIGMRPEEYREKIELVKEQLEEVYWLGYTKATSKDVFRAETVRPPMFDEWDSSRDPTKEE